VWYGNEGRQGQGATRISRSDLDEPNATACVPRNAEEDGQVGVCLDTLAHVQPIRLPSVCLAIHKNKNKCTAAVHCHCSDDLENCHLGKRGPRRLSANRQGCDGAVAI